MSRPRVEEATALLARNGPAAFRLSTELLYKILKNAEDPKKRSIRRSSNSFATNLKGAMGAVRFLRAVGFVEEGEGEEASLVLPASVSAAALEEAKAALKACVKAYAAAAEEARRVENEAAAEKLRDLREVSRVNKSRQLDASASERERLLRGLKADREELARQRDPNNIK